MNASIATVSVSGWIHRIAKGLGFIAPATARVAPTSETAAEADAAIAKAKGVAGPVVLLVTAFDAHGSRIGELAAPLARQGFAVETIGVDDIGVGTAEGLDALVAARSVAAAAGRTVAGAIVASPRALALVAGALGESLPRIVMLDPGGTSPKCASERVVPEAGAHSHLLVVHDLGDPDAADAETAAIGRAWGGAELFMTHGLPAALRASDGAFLGAIGEFLRRDLRAPPAVPVFPESVHTLRGGEQVLIREVIRSDVARKQAFLDGLSQDSRYNRFLAPRKLRPGEIARLCSLRPGREFAVAATVREEGREIIVGVGRYAATPEPGVVELGVVVTDAWQGRGLGEALLSAVIAQAARQGHARASGLVLATNKGMRRLAMKLGFTLRAAEGDARLVEIDRQLGGERDVALMALPTAELATA